jgi:hypothetical protein
MVLNKKLFFVSLIFFAITSNTPLWAQPSSGQQHPTQTATAKIGNPDLSGILSGILGLSAGAGAMVAFGLGETKNKRLKEIEEKTIDKIAGIVNAESQRTNSIVFNVSGDSFSGDLQSTIRSELKAIEIESKDRNKPIETAIESLVNNYHSQALSQATVQFYFSVAAATVGFGLIVYTGLNAVSTENPRKLLNTIPGMAISGVSVLFLKQAEETRRRATDLYDRLRSDERQAQAIALTNDIENLQFRSLVKAQLVLHLADVDTKSIDFSSHVSRLLLSSQSSDENGEEFIVLTKK